MRKFQVALVVLVCLLVVLPVTAIIAEGEITALPTAKPTANITQIPTTETTIIETIEPTVKPTTTIIESAYISDSITRMKFDDGSVYVENTAKNIRVTSITKINNIKFVSGGSTGGYVAKENTIEYKNSVKDVSIRYTYDKDTIKETIVANRNTDNITATLLISENAKLVNIGAGYFAIVEKGSQQWWKGIIIQKPFAIDAARKRIELNYRQRGNDLILDLPKEGVSYPLTIDPTYTVSNVLYNFVYTLTITGVEDKTVPIRFTIHNTTGTSVDTDLYFGANVLGNFNDTAFTSMPVLTKFPAYLHTRNTTTAEIYVDVPVTTTGTIVNVFYGNATAKSDWSTIPSIMTDTTNPYYSLDINRAAYFDKAQNNLTAGYITYGTPTWVAGAYVLDHGDEMFHTLPSYSTTGKWETVISFETAWTTNQWAYLNLGGQAGSPASYMKIKRSNAPGANEIFLGLVINSAEIIADTDTGTTLADSTYTRASITYDGTNYQMYWNDVAVGAATAGNPPAIPDIGIAGSQTQLKCIELDYLPGVAHTDPFTADTETRYMQLSSTDLSTWAASAAGDVVVDTGNTKITLASADDKGVVAVGKSYNYGSGEFEFAFDVVNDDGGGAERTGAVFAYQDINNHYKIVLEDNTAGAENLKFYKVVAGSATQLGTTKDVSATYTRKNKVHGKVQYSRETGQMWVYLRDDAGVYGTAPDISDAFSAAFKYGKFGYLANVTTAGAGNLNVDFYPMTIRANLLIGETNVPATETGFYFRDEFGSNSRGRYTEAGTGTWAIAGGNYGYTGAKKGYAALTPFKMSNTLIDATFSATMNTTSETKHTAISLLYDWLYDASTSYTPENGYRVNFGLTGVDKTLRLYRYDAHVGTQLGAYALTAGEFPDAGESHTIRVTCIAGAWTVYLDGVSKITASDTTYTSGYQAISAYQTTLGNMNAQFSDLTISGTRYYMKPMLRGAQVGEYWNGTSAVNATRLCYDFNSNDIDEFTQVIGGWSIDTNNGRLIGAHSSYGAGLIINNLYLNGGFFRYKISSTTGRPGILIGWDGLLSSGSNDIPTNGISISPSTGTSGVYVAGSRVLVLASPEVLNVGINVLWLPSSNYIKIWTDGGAVNSEYTNVLLNTGYTKCGFYSYNSNSGYGLYEYSANALESTSTNGVAYTLGGISHGARYDTNEYAGLCWTATAPEYREAYFPSFSTTTAYTPANNQIVTTDISGVYGISNLTPWRQLRAVEDIGSYSNHNLLGWDNETLYTNSTVGNRKMTVFTNYTSWVGTTYDSRGGTIFLMPVIIPSINGITYTNITTDAIPVANWTSYVISGLCPFVVQFTDQSTNAIAWNWSFGDGNFSELQNPQHSYDVIGSFDVKLSASNAYTSDYKLRSNYVTTYICTGGSTPAPTPTPFNLTTTPPIARFVANTTTGANPLTVQFYDLSIFSPTSWTWDFGDGNTSALQNPINTYYAVGTYTVSLTATNAYGSDTVTKVDYIVTNPAISGGAGESVANFVGSPRTGEIPLVVGFTDLSSINGTIISWDWLFGDGHASTLQNPYNTYNAVGLCTVFLSINSTSDGGVSYNLTNATKTNYINVVPVGGLPTIAVPSGIPMLPAAKKQFAPVQWIEDKMLWVVIALVLVVGWLVMRRR